MKIVLIPHDMSVSHGIVIKDLSPEDGLASDSIVGEVTAHQVDDQ